MSYKYQATQDGPNKYVLDKVGDMRCPVVAFLSPSLYEASDENLWQDAVVSASMPGAIGMYLMPDTHGGYTLPVGGVLVTSDTIIQAGSGYDISCGVIYLRVPGLFADRIVDWDTRMRWVREVERRVATGNHSNLPPLMRAAKTKTLRDVLRYGAKALGVSADLCERHYIEIDDSIFNEDTLFRRVMPSVPLIETAQQQLGSVGGGNHFIEMQVDEKDGSVWLMIHCGSRGYGFDLADAYFKKGAEFRGLPFNRRHESWLRLDEPLGREFWEYHNSAANYASANRHTIVDGVREATQAVFGCDVERYFEISHNLVQQETVRLPDGSMVKGFVHRKGATRAFPAGHPDMVGTVWEKTGHPCLIPGSMMAGAAILFPLEGAWESGCSVNHGSGRMLPRGKAKQDLAAIHDEIDHEMRTVKRTLGGVEVVGIACNTERTPLDECGHAYKDLDAVLDVLVQNGIARIDRRLFPVANLKGA